jgi:hypothetical protein
MPDGKGEEMLEPTNELAIKELVQDKIMVTVEELEALGVSCKQEYVPPEISTHKLSRLAQEIQE